ncbi:uncharacterized protein LOC127287825 [Leptopilina boulardi]|uniref:uncharacterized protein LOC127287825 n=1 Tax=Leptopilina boulardi TaxID=63433 RepID=UPI0021F68AEC|nr:uncharacterized protein LOC127287825 [Leptopilina boulardi]
MQLTAENAVLKAENLRLKEEMHILKNEKESQILKQLENVREDLKKKKKKTSARNSDSNTVTCAGVQICKDAFNEALDAKTISARVRKIASGYWPPKKIQFVGNKKPLGVSKKNWIKIQYKDYDNIRHMY